MQSCRYDCLFICPSSVSLSQIPHSCVVLHDSRFAIIVDGAVVDAASSFLDDGSRHSLTVLGHDFVLDCRAIPLPPPESNHSTNLALGSNDIAAGSLSSQASLFKMQAAASSVNEAALSSFIALLHPIPRGNILHDDAPTTAIASAASQLQPSNAKREHYSLYGTIIAALLLNATHACMKVANFLRRIEDNNNPPLSESLRINS